MSEQQNKRQVPAEAQAIKETYFINADGNRVEKDDNGQDISGLNANTDFDLSNFKDGKRQ